MEKIDNFTYWLMTGIGTASAILLFVMGIMLYLSGREAENSIVKRSGELHLATCFLLIWIGILFSPIVPPNELTQALGLISLGLIFITGIRLFIVLWRSQIRLILRTISERLEDD